MSSPVSYTHLDVYKRQVFQQLYNVADSVVAGRFVGEDALAAVGASFPITMIFMAVAPVSYTHLVLHALSTTISASASAS